MKWMFILVISVQSNEMPVATAGQLAAGASPDDEYSVSAGSDDEVQGLEQPESTRNEDDDVNDDVNDDANDASDAS